MLCMRSIPSHQKIFTDFFLSWVFISFTKFQQKILCCLLISACHSMEFSIQHCLLLHLSLQIYFRTIFLEYIQYLSKLFLIFFFIWNSHYLDFGIFYIFLSYVVIFPFIILIIFYFLLGEFLNVVFKFTNVLQLCISYYLSLFLL